MEFFLFAGLMGLDMLLFIFLAVRYTYVEAAQDDSKVPPAETSSLKAADSSPDNKNLKQQKGLDNKAFNDSSM